MFCGTVRELDDFGERTVAGFGAARVIGFARFLGFGIEGSGVFSLSSSPAISSL